MLIKCYFRKGDSVIKFSRILYGVSALIVILLAAYLRSQALSETIVEFNGVRGDAVDYLTYAYNISKSDTYSRQKTFGLNDVQPQPDALRSPGYPFYISLFLVKENPDTNLDGSLHNVLVSQAVLSVLVVIIWLYLFSQYFPALLTIFGGLLVAISPHLVNANIYFLTESLFTFLLSLLFLAIHISFKKSNVIWPVIAVVLIALASLTRPSMQYFIVPFLFLYWYFDPKRFTAKIVLSLFCMFFMLIGSWHVRNIVSTGHWSDPTLKANFLQHGMYPGFKFNDQAETLGFPYRYDPENERIYGKPELVIDEIKKRVESDPTKYLRWYFVGKPIFLYSWSIISGMGGSFIYSVLQSPYIDNSIFRISHSAAYGFHWPTAIFALVGLLLLFLPTVSKRMQASERQFIYCVGVFVIYFTALHIVGAPFPRYGIPVRPFITMLALFSIWQIYSSFRRIKAEKSCDPK